VHPADLQCATKFSVCEARKERDTARKQEYEESKAAGGAGIAGLRKGKGQQAFGGDFWPLADAKDAKVGHVTETVKYDSIDAAKAWDKRSAAAAATSKDCEASLASCYTTAIENGDERGGGVGSTLSPAKEACRAVYDDCWKHNMRRAAAAGMPQWRLKPSTPPHHRPRRTVSRSAYAQPSRLLPILTPLRPPTCMVCCNRGDAVLGAQRHRGDDGDGGGARGGRPLHHGRGQAQREQGVRAGQGEQRCGQGGGRRGGRRLAPGA